MPLDRDEHVRHMLKVGDAWYERHADHVDGILANDFERRNFRIEPTGIDAYHPELWKDIHWRWFFAEKARRIVALTDYRKKNNERR